METLPKELLGKIGTMLYLQDDWLNYICTCKRILSACKVKGFRSRIFSFYPKRHKWVGLHTVAIFNKRHVYISILKHYKYLKDPTDYHIKFDIEFLSKFSSLYSSFSSNSNPKEQQEKEEQKIQDIKINLSRHIISPSQINKTIYKKVIKTHHSKENAEGFLKNEGFVILKYPEGWNPAIYVETQHLMECIREIILGVSLIS